MFFRSMRTPHKAKAEVVAVDDGQAEVTVSRARVIRGEVPRPAAINPVGVLKFEFLIRDNFQLL